MYLGRDNIIKKAERKKTIRKLIILTIIIVVGIFAFKKISILPFGDKINKNPIINDIVENKDKSIFNIRELNIKELNNRIILLNVYNVKDFSYFLSVNLADKIEKEYKNKIVVIDIITDEIKLDNNVIVNYIVKNNIERPTISISNFNLENTENQFDKYFVLINSNGMVEETFELNDGTENKLISSIDNILAEKPKINTEKLENIELEKFNSPQSFISSLNYIIFANNIKNLDRKPYFIISDSKEKRILFIGLDGEIETQLGNGETGSNDGKDIEANFCYPAGLTMSDDAKFLYVADTCNNSIREVDLETKEITTLIKDNPLLKNPVNIEILDDNLIISSVSSQNTLLKYDFDNAELSEIECEDCDQYITTLKKHNDKIYFINNANYGLYSLNKDMEIVQEIDFNSLNEKNEIKISGNNKFYIDDTGLYLIDKFNNRILKIKDDEVENYSYNKDGEEIYNLPSDIVNFRDKIYITNEGNKNIVILDKTSQELDILDIVFSYNYNQLKISDNEFLDTTGVSQVSLKSGEDNKIKINLENGYSFEGSAPQSLSLYEEDLENNTATLIKHYTKREILDNEPILILPKLENNKNYYLTGNFYYCNYDKNTPCLINNYKRRIVSSDLNSGSVIEINFIY